LSGTLPIGKGMASSSADLVASARAVADAYRLVLDPTEIEELIRGIEPSDGVMYDGAVAFCHCEVRLLARLGPLPPMTVVGVDEGGVIDTVAFNGVPKSYTLEDMYEYEIMLAGVRDAVKSGDAATLGDLATRSARMNQRMAPKRLLEPMLQLSQDQGALGVVAAHSGTSLGLLLSDEDPAYAEKLDSLFVACSEFGAAVHIDHSFP
jgi:L-threonine kinase